MRKTLSLSKKISCIINPSAAQNKWKRRKKLRSYLQKNLPGKIIDFYESKEDTVEIAKKLSHGHNILVAVGGDGTVADVIQGILDARREKNVYLGIVPFGSGNAFRKSLKIPKNAKKAVKRLTDGEIREMDLIDVEGRAAGFASIGATAKVTQKKLSGRTQGLLGHILASRIMVNLSKKEQEIELIDGLSDTGEHFDKKVLRLRLLDCVVGKTNYFGYNWRIAPKANIDDGYLDITFFEISSLKFLLFFPLIYFGLLQKTQKHFKARKMIVRGRELPVQYNGEFLGTRDEIELRVLPRALKVIYPKYGN